MTLTIYLYTMSESEHSQLAKQLLDHHKISYHEVTVDNDDAAREDLVEKTGQLSVPALVVMHDDHIDYIVTGYDKKLILQAIGQEEKKDSAES